LPDPSLDQLAEGVPRITNETVAEHREEVLGSARKYIYPLQHSKHRIVIITTSIVVIFVIAFFSYCTLALYRFKSSSGFLYAVTRVVPFPVARAGTGFVAYEDYLFELRHYTHYYETQQKVDFKSESGKQQLADYQKRALENVINNAYVKQLASKNKVSVSNQEVENTLNTLREQNRLGASDKGFEDVLKDNFGWSLADFKRALKQQLLAQKVVSTLDTDARARAEAAMAELKSGADFAAVAKKYSDDTATKDNGGDMGPPIDKSNRDLAPQTSVAIFSLPAGQISDIVNTGYGLEIVKVLDVQGEKVHAAHITFNFRDISTYINELKEKKKPHAYIKI